MRIDDCARNCFARATRPADAPAVVGFRSSAVASAALVKEMSILPRSAPAVTRLDLNETKAVDKLNQDVLPVLAVDRDDIADEVQAKAEREGDVRLVAVAAEGVAAGVVGRRCFGLAIRFAAVRGVGSQASDQKTALISERLPRRRVELRHQATGQHGDGGRSDPRVLALGRHP